MVSVALSTGQKRLRWSQR